MGDIGLRVLMPAGAVSFKTLVTSPIFDVHGGLPQTFNWLDWDDMTFETFLGENRQPPEVTL